MEIDLEILSCFCDEAQDLLVRWEGLCLEMSKGVQAGNLDELFRIAHNLKGSSRVVGLESFGNFVHKVEDGITDLKKGSVQVTPPVLQQLLKAQEILNNWIIGLKTNPAHAEEYESFLSTYRDAFSGTVSETPKPAVIAVKVEEPKQEQEEVKVVPIAEAKPAVQKAVIEKAALEKKGFSDETVRVSAKKIEQLLEIMGELSIHQSVIYHSLGSVSGASSQLNHSSYLARKITRELYEKTLSLRMVPIQPVFQRLERSIRELAATLNKEVEVEVSGGEVELDKTVCEKIIEPLTHMVRNSIDHGLESLEARLDSGKNPIGKIKVSAVQDSGSVNLWIEDDGRGLNEDRIRAKAIANGLIEPDAEMDPAELHALIFHPGFSTADKVTDVSGRGVGMDVVMKTVESLKGEIKISSTQGKGTQFRISLPTTLIIIDSLIVNLRGMDYAVPVSTIDEIIHLTETDFNEEERMFRIHNKVVPIHSLSECLNVKGWKDPVKHKSILVTRYGTERVAFKVDQIVEQQQIVVRKFAPGLDHVFGLSGGTILGNGQPGLIVDLKSIAEHCVLKVKPKTEKVA